ECPVLDVGPENSSSYTSSELSESEEVGLPLPPAAKAMATIGAKAAPKATTAKKCQSVSSSDVSSSESEAEASQKAVAGVRLSPTISPPRLREVMAGKRNVDMAILDRYHEVFCS
ncbi:unnamed protein product, partial [Effrenium voratum]